MFDPSVLDPLVQENGIEQYGLIIRMDYLAGICLYADLAMYEHESTFYDEEKRKMCHSTSIKRFLSRRRSSTLNLVEDEIHDLMLWMLDKVEKELDPSTSDDKYCVLFDAASSNKRHLSMDIPENTFDDDDTFLPIPMDDIQGPSNDIFQPIDSYKHSFGVLLDVDNNANSDKTFPSLISNEVSHVFDWNRLTHAIKIKQDHLLKNQVPLEPVNKRFVEIDELLRKQQEAYFGPHRIEVPYYLRLKTSTHLHDLPSLKSRQLKKTNDRNLDNIYGRKQLKQEYWFSIPKEKTDALYSFFLHWTPERALDPLIDDDKSPLNIDQSKSINESTKKGFVVVPDDNGEQTQSELKLKGSKTNSKRNEPKKERHYLSRQNTLLKDWEIISVDEIYRRINSVQIHGTDDHGYGIPAPTLLQPSTLFDEKQSKQILLELPARVHGLNWYLIFSTEAHGFSLNQLYRRSVEIDHDLPALIVIKDVNQNVFGAFVSHQLIVSEGFYGTGESFLFTLQPEFRVFNWTGYNEFFVKGDLHSIGFGIGDGTYGLWLDRDLYHGRTCPTKTFNNDRLTPDEDFIIASVEVWTFVD